MKTRDIQQLLAAGNSVDHLRIVVPRSPVLPAPGSTEAKTTAASKRDIVVQISGRRKKEPGELRAALIRRAPAELRAPVEGPPGQAVVDQVHKYMEILTSEFQETMGGLGEGIHVTFDDFQVLSDWHVKLSTGVQDKTDKVSGLVDHNFLYTRHVYWRTHYLENELFRCFLLPVRTTGALVHASTQLR
jgi:hypothetical protein